MATRTRVYDEDGGLVFWFDVDAAERWDENTVWNGSNHISMVTGSQWNHQQLYRTRKGRWVLLHTSEWQGSLDRYEAIGDAEAAEWFVRNEYSVREIPDELIELIDAQEG